MAPVPSDITISRKVFDEIRAHAREEAPNECCGLLLGTQGVIERSARARNLEASPARYLIDPEDHFAAVRAARELHLSVIGAYHSHPQGVPVPSSTDLDESSGDATFVYLIVSLAEHDDEAMRAYFLKGGEGKPLGLIIAP